MDTHRTEEHVLGFDARIAPSRAPWSAERRSLFLLRPDVQSPLSTDTAVWPSLYDQGSEAERLGLPMLQPPGWRGPNADLWDNLGTLEGHLDIVKTLPPYWLVAFVWIADDAALQDARSEGPYIETMTPAMPSPEWEFLGYDVSDASLLSGLTNCGYGDEQAMLSEGWGPLLNEHHLFNDGDDAFGFRRLSNQRVSEHAPFFVYGLWLIEKVQRP